MFIADDICVTLCVVFLSNVSQREGFQSYVVGRAGNGMLGIGMFFYASPTESTPRRKRRFANTLILAIILMWKVFMILFSLSLFLVSLFTHR